MNSHMILILILSTALAYVTSFPYQPRSMNVSLVQNTGIPMAPITSSNPAWKEAFGARNQNEQPAKKVGETAMQNEDTLFQELSLFEDPAPEPIQPKVMNGSRPACAKSKKQTFCDFGDVPDYPRDKINSLVAYDRNQFNDLFGLGASVGVDVTLRRLGNEIMGITDSENAEMNICDKMSNIFYPRSARNSKNNWVYVVNDDEYVQAVTSETCRSEDTACNYLQDSLPLGFKSICRQKYSYKRLLAVDPKKGTTYTDKFPMPSCCTCYLQSDSFGISLKTLRKTPKPTRQQLHKTSNL